jgi:hypothetical protein
MANFEDEHDEPARKDEEHLSAPGSWNRPWLLAAIGLALMLGGYAAMNYVPPAAQPSEVERRKDAGLHDGLPERSNQAAPPSRESRYQMVGRLAIYFGLFLFGLAGVSMYRSSPPPRRDDDPDVEHDAG